MNRLAEQLAQKRIQNNMMSFGNSNHIACILSQKDITIVQVGINKYNKTTSAKMVHAETDAINNLPVISKNKKHLKKINLFVIRTTVTGKIGMSKPCLHCIHNLFNLPKKKGYVVKNIYYSDSNGDIITTNLKQLLLDENHHVTKYHRGLLAYT
jgi:cytidine deaminase